MKYSPTKRRKCAPLVLLCNPHPLNYCDRAMLYSSMLSERRRAPNRPVPPTATLPIAPLLDLLGADELDVVVPAPVGALVEVVVMVVLV